MGIRFLIWDEPKSCDISGVIPDLTNQIVRKNKMIISMKISFQRTTLLYLIKWGSFLSENILIIPIHVRNVIMSETFDKYKRYLMNVSRYLMKVSRYLINVWDIDEVVWESMNECVWDRDKKGSSRDLKITIYTIHWYRFINLVEIQCTSSLVNSAEDSNLI